MSTTACIVCSAVDSLLNSDHLHVEADRNFGFSFGFSTETDTNGSYGTVSFFSAKDKPVSVTAETASGFGAYWPELGTRQYHSFSCYCTQDESESGWLRAWTVQL